MPFILSTLSGVSTLIGFLFIYIKYDKDKIIKYSLAFAAGIMLSVSIIDLIPESITLLMSTLTKIETFISLLIFLTLGSLIPFIIDKLLDKRENELYRVGVLSMIAIIIHNVPEGIATFLTTTNNIKLGISMTIAISLHNIPEGISIAIPVYYSSKNKKKAFKMTLLSGISEPLGALLAHLFLKSIVTDKIMGILLIIIAGIMANISLVELLPKSLNYKNKKKTIFFFLIGIIFMYSTIKLMK